MEISFGKNIDSSMVLHKDMITQEARLFMEISVDFETNKKWPVKVTKPKQMDVEVVFSWFTPMK